MNNCTKGKGDSSSIKPLAYFSMNKPVFKIGEAVQFINKSLNASSYYWDFGDGNSSTEINPSHTYTTSGIFKVSLTAENDAGTSIYFEKPLVKDFTVMTYNICGGGAIPEFIEIAIANGHTQYLSNRMPQILSIIREVDPDILGLQEAYLWDSYDPPYFERIADSLDMYYYFIKHEEVEWNGIAIYSKFPIESTSFMKHQHCIADRIVNGTFMVEAAVRIDNEKLIDVLVCHFINENPGPTVTCEVETLQKRLKEDFNPYTILMGDMNSASGQPYSQYFSEAGLYCGDLRYGDQIWSSLKLFNKSITFCKHGLSRCLSPSIYNLLTESSDHQPVITHFAF